MHIRGHVKMVICIKCSYGGILTLLSNCLIIYYLHYVYCTFTTQLLQNALRSDGNVGGVTCVPDLASHTVINS